MSTAPETPPAPDDDIVATRAENARLRAELEKAKRPKAPAPAKKAADPAPDPVPEKKRKARVSRRYWGAAADDD